MELSMDRMGIVMIVYGIVMLINFYEKVPMRYDRISKIVLSFINLILGLLAVPFGIILTLLV